jgi:hypothetical protein
MNNTEYNPLQINSSEKLSYYLYDTELKNIIDSNHKKDSICPICYNNIKDSIICIPFNCSHIICFKCFRKYCFSFPDYDRKKKVKCPCCRNSVRKSWIKHRNITVKTYICQNTEYNIYVPKIK